MQFRQFLRLKILREINVGEFRSVNIAFLAIFWGSEFCQFGKFQPSKSAKMHENQDFAILESRKLISRKIWVIEKSWNLHAVLLFSKNVWILLSWLMRRQTFVRESYFNDRLKLIHVWRDWNSSCFEFQTSSFAYKVKRGR